MVTNKAKDQHWRSLLEKSSQRKMSERISEDDVRKIFFSIDKDQSGEITQKVFIYIDLYLYRRLLLVFIGGCQSLPKNKCDGKTWC